MKITFLGTGTSQGVPVIGCECLVCKSKDVRDKRLRSSVLVETSDMRIVIDCGPDFRQQMLRENIRSIDAILITHGHKDHIGGLDDVRPFNYFLQRPADVYATSDVARMIQQEFSYAFGKDKYPGAPEIVIHGINDDPFTIGGINIIPVKARHFRDQFVHGFRIGDFTYITDAMEISPQEKKKIAGSKIVVINALRKKKHYSHFNLEEAVTILEELAPEKGYLTHISDQMGTTEEIEKDLPDFIRLAYDRLTLEY